MDKEYLFTSESVSEGHPDKICDQISDAVLDYLLEKDEFSHCACEVYASHNRIIVGGEVKSKVTEIPVDRLVREVFEGIGYNKSNGFDINKCIIENCIYEQSQEIYDTVERELHIGAGDQGMMFGYACDETIELMPLPIVLAHKIVMKQAEVRKSGLIDFLAPDAKSQVTLKYVDDKPVSAEKIILSTQHTREYSFSESNALKRHVMDAILPEELKSKSTVFVLNPSASFIVGGIMADTGLTGRKIVVDTYGGSCPHGGGAFSGKDATKVDRSGAYMARYIAKNIVASGLAKKCTVQLSYSIGFTDVLSLYIDLHRTGVVDEQKLDKAVREIFSLSPKGIIESLNLRRPIFTKTTNYGHFGRELEGFTWEKKDKVDDLKNYFNV